MTTGPSSNRKRGCSSLTLFGTHCLVWAVYSPSHTLITATLCFLVLLFPLEHVLQPCLPCRGLLGCNSAEPELKSFISEELKAFIRGGSCSEKSNKNL